MTIEQLADAIQRQFPDAKLEVREPASPEGVWFLDLQRGDAFAVVEWSPSQPFGLSTPSEAYGTAADETYEELGELCARLADILEREAITSPPEDKLPLKELRHLCGLSQQELARRLHVQQPAISKLERRQDLPVSALRRWIEALGGELTIVAKVGGKTVELSQFSTRSSH